MNFVFWFLAFLQACQSAQAFFGLTKNFNSHQEPQFRVLKYSKQFSIPEEKWIEQSLDNFNPQETRKWEMRYFQDMSYFLPDGPIFIYLGGEWTISARSLMEGTLINEMAKDSNGALFYTEHRFYGKSKPTLNTTTENLKFLSSEQALADVASFINFIRSSLPEMNNSKVIVVGASYSATLAAWMRLKYPHLVDGAFASSAPVHAKLDFFEYKEIMAQSIVRVGGDKCRDIIKNAFNDMEELVETKNTTRITKAFNLCKELETPVDTPHFFYEISDIVAGLVQSHRNENIERACEVMEKARSTEDDIEAFAIWIRGENAVVTKGIQKDSLEDQKNCLDFSYENSIATFSNIEWGSLANQQMRQWIYQTCSEFAWFQTSTSKNQFFGTTYGVDYFLKICNDLYDQKFERKSVEFNIRRTNNRFGGFQPRLSNVVFTNGDLDPWHPMSVLTDISESVVSIMISLSSHVSDLGAISENDSIQLRTTKQRVKELILQWIGILNISTN